MRGAAARAPTEADGRAGVKATGGTASRARRLQVVVADGSRDEAVLALAADLLADVDEVRHVLLFAASADHAADLGDLLAVHGYRPGAPGDETAPVWLCPGDEAEDARDVLIGLDRADEVATVSCTMPPGADAATVRHGGPGGAAWVVAAVREMGHLRQVAAGAGMTLKRVRPERQPRVSAALAELADQLHDAVRAPEITPYQLLVESLGDRFAATEVAAAALLMLDRERAAKRRAAGGAGALRPGVGGAAAPGPPGGAPVKWVKLFVSTGSQDDIGPGNLLGAITSESGVDGERVGRIDVRDRHSLVEVHEGDAARIIRSLNGITLGGRALRVDYDRAATRATKGGRPGPRGGRPGPGGGRPGPGGGRPGPGGGRPGPGGGRPGPGGGRPGPRGGRQGHGGGRPGPGRGRRGPPGRAPGRPPR